MKLWVFGLKCTVHVTVHVISVDCTQVVFCGFVLEFREVFQLEFSSFFCISAGPFLRFLGSTWNSAYSYCSSAICPFICMLRTLKICGNCSASKLLLCFLSNIFRLYVCSAFMLMFSPFLCFSFFFCRTFYPTQIMTLIH